MIFADTFTVSAGTARASPLTRQLELVVGIIHQVEITFLDGPENEVNVIVRRALHQIVPTNEGASIVGNNVTVRASLHQPILDAPLRVEIDAWSPDADYDHEVTVRVHMLPEEVLQPERPELSILQRLSRAILGGRS